MEPKALFPETYSPFVVTATLHIPNLARRPDALRHIAESLLEYAKAAEENRLAWLDDPMEWKFQVAGITSLGAIVDG